MTITAQTFYGGYKQLCFSTVAYPDGYYLPVLGHRFIRVVCVDLGGELFLPAANTLPLIRGGSVFTIWNEGYFNITIKDVDGGLVGCMQGTSGGSGSAVACWSNVHLLDTTTAAGDWLISCGDCEDEPAVGTTDTCDSDETDGTNTVTGPGGGTDEDDKDCTDEQGHNLPQDECLW